MPIHLGTATIAAAAATDSSTPAPPEEEEFYSSWSLFLVCLLLILSLWTSYYLQIKRIRAIHETFVSIIAGMVVGFIVRVAPGHLIREMLVSCLLTYWPVFRERGVGKQEAMVKRHERGERWEGIWPRRVLYQSCVFPRAFGSLSHSVDLQAHPLLQPPPSTHHFELWL
jgi:hypothetical protein